jgi:hypothetical protein
MAQSRTGKATHDAAVDAAESTRQSTARASGRTRSTVRNAEIAYYRACLASAKANGVEQGVFIGALWELGVRDA